MTSFEYSVQFQPFHTSSAGTSGHDCGGLQEQANSMGSAGWRLVHALRGPNNWMLVFERQRDDRI